jgi:diaminopimelate epimerase
MKIEFVKMHGIGNDFILINCLNPGYRIQDTESESLAKKLCDRRFGIGADQLLLLYPSKIADFRMRILNADGSEVEMCGNGIRCLAKYIWDRKLSDKRVLTVETLAGVIKPEKAGELVRVDMGEPIFDPERIPVNIQETDAGSPKSERTSNLESQISNLIMDYPLQIADREFKVTCLSMGNPHAVIVVDDVLNYPVTHYGPMLETHPAFPRRINVEFIELLSEKEIRMRVWERGSGETMACGTGASAVAVASYIKGLTDRKVTIHLLGGDLFIEWGSDNRVYMSGPAVEVFSGTIVI